MEMARNTAREHLATAQQRQKAHYDTTARCKSFEIGDEVLYLTPTKTNKLQVDWTGPWKVIKRHSGVNYSIYDEQSNMEKLVHVNMLKPYVNRSVNVCMIISGEETGTFPFWEGNRKAYRSSEQVKVDEGLSQSQQKQVKKLLNKYDHLYPFEIKHVKGKNNIVADSLSSIRGCNNEGLCLYMLHNNALDLFLAKVKEGPWLAQEGKEQGSPTFDAATARATRAIGGIVRHIRDSTCLEGWFLELLLALVTNFIEVTRPGLEAPSRNRSNSYVPPEELAKIIIVLVKRVAPKSFNRTSLHPGLTAQHRRGRAALEQLSERSPPTLGLL
ncbi:uncharacterized protein LOC134298646 [Anolis carolinensis]|uniref:uncharacterized protein LOC134298646 n=1 Tax=Anolis carolinensis TaxID=28377 RepID=UPI002F2B1BC7